jgi:hypothetical protein
VSVAIGAESMKMTDAVGAWPVLTHLVERRNERCVLLEDFFHPLGVLAVDREERVDIGQRFLLRRADRVLKG